MKIQVFKYMYTHKSHVLGGFVKKKTTCTVLIHNLLFLKYIKVIIQRILYCTSSCNKTSGTRICN